MNRQFNQCVESLEDYMRHYKLPPQDELFQIFARYYTCVNRVKDYKITSGQALYLERFEHSCVPNAVLINRQVIIKFLRINNFRIFHFSATFSFILYSNVPYSNK